MSLLYIFGYFGSKRRLISAISMMLPLDCTQLWEVCGGSGAFVLNRHFRFKKAVYNEYNEKIFKIVKLLKDEKTRIKFIERIVTLTHNEEWFTHCQKNYNNDFKVIEDEIEQAAMTYTLITDSYNNEKKFYVAPNKRRKNYKFGLMQRLLRVGQELEYIHIMNEDCFDIISKHGNNEKAFIFADIPYPWAVRKSLGSYGGACYDWPDETHQKFIDLVRDIKAKIMVCTYSSELYDQLLANPKWHKVMIKKLCSPAGKEGNKRQPRYEYVYINYANYSDMAKYYIDFSK